MPPCSLPVLGIELRTIAIRTREEVRVSSESGGNAPVTCRPVLMTDKGRSLQSTTARAAFNQFAE